MKTAVILVGRKERDCNIPYPLMPFNGDECLLDRTLIILNDLSFEQIYIVCGYQAQLFDKYNNGHVKVLYNPAYGYTASMASLATARNEIIS